MLQPIQGISPALSFHETTFDVVDRNGQHWLQAADIARALGYAADDAVSRIYRRRADEFTEAMSQTVKLTVSGNYQKDTRIFSLRGAHLIAMFARTPVAKEFRRWVLDILDCEAAQPSTPKRNGITAAQVRAARAHIKAARQQLAKMEEQVTEWELLGDALPPNPCLRATVKHVSRHRNGDWELYVNCGHLEMSVRIPKAAMRRGGVVVGDSIRIEYRKGDSPLVGPYTHVFLSGEQTGSEYYSQR